MMEVLEIWVDVASHELLKNANAHTDIFGCTSSMI